MEIQKAFRNGFILVIGLLLIIASDLNATHLRAGEITVERISCQGLTFRITITIFTDVGPGITAKFGDGFLKFGDGTPDEVVPILAILILFLLRGSSTNWDYLHSFMVPGLTCLTSVYLPIL